jgi:hypothetical protein
MHANFVLGLMGGTWANPTSAHSGFLSEPKLKKDKNIKYNNKNYKYLKKQSSILNLERRWRRPW